MHTHQTKTLRKDERGFASIVIALILIVILGLLTVGFAQLARREQQNALDKQLASQAYDAAESGINDAYHDITTIDPSTVSALNPAGEPYINTNNVPPSLTNTCLTTKNVPTNANGGLNYTANQAVNSQNGVSYSCLMVNLTPPDIQYDNVAPDSARNITFSTSTANGVSTLASLKFTWSTDDNQIAIPATLGNFPPVGAGSWNSPAVLQVSITPLPLPGTIFSRSSLINNTYTTYLYPSNKDATSAYAPNSTSPGSQGGIQASDCSKTAGTCTATITGLASNPYAIAGEPYVINILDYYDESKTITFNGTDVNGHPVSFFGQSQIDVTGKARYVLKRIQVVIQQNNLPPLPPYAIEGQNICKRFNTYPAATTPDASLPSIVACSTFN